MTVMTAELERKPRNHTEDRMDGQAITVSLNNMYSEDKQERRSRKMRVIASIKGTISCSVSWSKQFSDPWPTERSDGCVSGMEASKLHGKYILYRLPHSSL